MTSLEWRRQDWANAVSFRRIGTSAKAFEFFLSGGGVLGPVDLLQCRCDSLAVLVGNEVQRIADQVNDAGLDLGLWNWTALDGLAESASGHRRQAIRTS